MSETHSTFSIQVHLPPGPELSSQVTAVERQATDRAHRIGQDKPVLVYKLITRHTVEERIQELQSRKSQLADALLDDKDSPVSGLQEQDIHWLFSPL